MIYQLVTTDRFDKAFLRNWMTQTQKIIKAWIDKNLMLHEPVFMAGADFEDRNWRMALSMSDYKF